MKKLLRLISTLAALCSVSHAAPTISFLPPATPVEVGQIFKLDVIVSFNALSELGEPAELSGFGFNFANSSNLLFDHVVLNSGYDDLSFFPDEVVAFAGISGGSTDSVLTIASFFFSAQQLGTATFSVSGDHLDDSGVLGLYYTAFGNLNDPLDDHYFAFDVAGTTQIAVTAGSAVPEPATTGIIGGGVLLLLIVMRRRNLSIIRH